MQLTDQPRRGQGWRLAAIVATALWCAAGCDPVVPLTTQALSNPRDIAVACVDNGQVLSLSECNSSVGDKRLRTFVSSGSRGTIAVGKPHVPEWIDNDPAIPGFTPLLLDGLPQQVTISNADPQHLYTTLPVRREVARVDILTGKPDAMVTLPFSPGAMVMHEPGKRLLLADPAGGSLWTVALAAFDKGGAAQEVPVQGAAGLAPIGGSPHSLAWVDYSHDDDGDGASEHVAHLFVGHLDHGHITVLKLSDLSLVARLPIDAQCADGVDNDGDGKTDAADSGCDDRDDPFEGDPEVGAACSDGLDNDGDGRTDAADLGCAATPLHDTCRDGIDNDGDGKTDYPDDPGCSGFAGSSEARDNPSCGDGIDNDGDGKTDTDDGKCGAAAEDKELAAVKADVITPCNDGLDNDGDGKTDIDDSDCGDKLSGGEVRPVCADGIDNDGDGRTDIDDGDCYNRAGASEVSVALAPAAIVRASHNGRFVAVGHRRRQQLLVLDTAKLAFLKPIPGQSTPFLRASKLGTTVLPAGVELGYSPLAIAPIQHDSRDAFAVTLQLRGMVVVQLVNSAGGRAIGLVQASDQAETSAFKPGLQVAGKTIDMASSVPERYASFGSLTKKIHNDSSLPTEFYGLTMTKAAAEHRTESWRLVFEGLLPGGQRRTGKLASPTMLVDAHADFCQLGVVPGDMLLLHRGAGAKDCGGMSGDVVRYRIEAVGADALTLAKEGTVDTPVTADNQKTFDGTAVKKLAAADPSCFPRGGVRYSIRASQWLVRGSVSGLASAVRRDDGGCEESTLSARIDATRLVQPELKEEGGKAVALPACPIRDDEALDDLATHFGVRDYATGKLGAMSKFSNAVFTGRFMPGCKPGADLSEAATLLPSIRDATWTYAVVSGFRERLAKVGVLAVSMATDAALPHAYVIDQGTSSLRAVSLNDLGVQTSLE